MMKKNLIVLLAFVIGLNLNAQKTVSAVFNKEETVIWFGLDFTNAQFVGIAPNSADEAGDIKDKWIPSWNKLMVAETKKFNVTKFFKKASAFYDFDSVDKLNKDIDESKIVVRSSKLLENPKELAAKSIAHYESESSNDGLGMVYLVEYFDKHKEEASFYVVFFDIASKEILLCERVTAPPAGFGIRNHWAGSVYNSMKFVSKKKWKAWRKQYLN